MIHITQSVIEKEVDQDIIVLLNFPIVKSEIFLTIPGTQEKYRYAADHGL